MIFTNYTQFYRDRSARGIEYAASHTRALGFNGVEYFGRAHAQILPEAGRERQVLDREGLTVSCYSILAQLFTSDQKTVEEQMARHVEAAAILGSPYLHHTLFPPISMKTVTESCREVFEGVVDLAERIAKRCHDYGITCLYEPQGVYFNGVVGLSKIYEELKARGCDVGICGDFGNSLFVDVDPVEIFDHFASEIRHVHMKDYRMIGRGASDESAYESLSGKRFLDAPLGEGVVDFVHGFRVLRSVGYDGAVSFELEGGDDTLCRSLARIKSVIASQEP